MTALNKCKLFCNILYRSSSSRRLFSTKLAKVAGVRPDGRSIRFYRHVTVQQTKDSRKNREPTADGEPEQSWVVELDGRHILTPQSHLLQLPNQAVALLVAGEWYRQQKTIKPHTMPFMTLATSVIDEAPGQRATIIKNLCSFLGSDTACVRSDAPEVAAEQDQRFGPLIDWFQGAVGSELPVRHGLLGAGQPVPESTLTTVQWMLFGRSDHALVGLEAVAQCTKSCLIPLALLAGKLTGKQAADWSLLEEAHQRRLWGQTTGPSGTDLDEADLHARISAAAVWLRLCPQDS